MLNAWTRGRAIRAKLAAIDRSGNEKWKLMRNHAAAFRRLVLQDAQEAPNAPRTAILKAVFPSSI